MQIEKRSCARIKGVIREEKRVHVGMKGKSKRGTTVLDESCGVGVSFMNEVCMSRPESTSIEDEWIVASRCGVRDIPEYKGAKEKKENDRPDPTLPIRSITIIEAFPHWDCNKRLSKKKY